MSFRTILAAIGDDQSGTMAAEFACALGARFAAHVTGFHVRPGTVDLAGSDAVAFSMPSGDLGWIDQIEDESRGHANERKTAFMKVASNHGLNDSFTANPKAGSASWREEKGGVAELVAREAMFHDLAVLGRSARAAERGRSETVELALLRSGRPVLVAPDGADSAIGEHIAFGWNESPEAVRALTASMPLLEAAREVSIVSVGQESLDGAARLAEYLDWRGVAAFHWPVKPVSGVGPGRQLLQAARERRADLVVMGGYGRAPWREALSGGATRDALALSRLPVLLAH